MVKTIMDNDDNNENNNDRIMIMAMIMIFIWINNSSSMGNEWSMTNLDKSLISRINDISANSGTEGISIRQRC